MARINIDDDVESRPEYRRLHKILGYDDNQALGMLVRFWRLAQGYWGEYRLVPLEEIENWELQAIIDSRWGIVKPEGVYAIGAEERFAWYRQKCDASKKGGRPKQPDKTEPPQNPTSDKPEETGTKPELTGAEPEDEKTEPRIDSVNPLVPVLVPVPVPVLALSQIQNSIGAASPPELKNPPSRGGIGKTLRTQDPAKAEAAKKAQDFVAKYVKAYQTRYPDGRPEDLHDGKVRGQILNWIKDYPMDRACQLIQVYFQMDTKWFGTKGYDFLTFRNNLNKIGQALDSGKDPDGNEVDWQKMGEEVGAL